MNLKEKEIPEYYGKPYAEISDNKPDFQEMPQVETYKKLGGFKSCGREYEIYSAYVRLGSELISQGKRRYNKRIKMPDFYYSKHDNIIGGFLFNNCHLIAHQLVAERIDKRNLVIGTRYMNEIGMWQFEETVSNYFKHEGNQKKHILYRVTPAYHDGDRLVKGIQMEAYSVEDDGKEICFNVFIHNVQPGIAIDYENGNSKQDTEWFDELFSKNVYTDDEKGTQNYILNPSAHIFHNPGCNCVSQISNKKEYKWPRQFLIDNGYRACVNCKA